MSQAPTGSAGMVAPPRPSLQVGCHVPVFGPIATRESVLGFARRMEALGYDSLWASDHVVIPRSIRSRYPYSASGELPIPFDANVLEPLTTLALVAGVTERVALGTTVLVLPHRHPVLAAKMLATLDHLSKGRVIAGVGVGWMREEIELLGAPFDRRGAWSDEAIRLMRACWQDGVTSFHGTFFSFDEMGVFPRPVRGTIPIWIGGHTRVALRRVAALGDGWHAAYASLPALEQGLVALREECGRRGRRIEDLAITLRSGLSIRSAPAPAERRMLQGSPEQIAGDLRALRGLGVSTVLLEARTVEIEDTIRIYERFAREIRPRVD